MTDSQKNPAKFRSSIRIGMHEYFLEMALASFELYQVLYNGLISNKAEGGFIYGEQPQQHFIYRRHNEITWAEQQIVLEIIKAIVFLNMYCEAYIWDLAARILGDKFAKKHLDKLDTLSKWIIIPKLLFSQQIDEGHHSIGILKELITLRNDFVHSKSKDGAAFIRNPQEYPGELVPLEDKINLYKIFDGIKDLFTQLDSMDPGNSHCLNFKRSLTNSPSV